ncbi:MAG: hypothetical protein R3286_16820, partial [Gammaproteobacteria bacterium]|nr:hypothetical protein [Gammaproteobacteria bacterium]
MRRHDISCAPAPPNGGSRNGTVTNFHPKLITQASYNALLADSQRTSGDTMQVRDLMTKRVVSAPIGTPVQVAFELMRQ